MKIELILPDNFLLGNIEIVCGTDFSDSEVYFRSIKKDDKTVEIKEGKE